MRVDNRALWIVCLIFVGGMIRFSRHCIGILAKTLDRIQKMCYNIAVSMNNMNINLLENTKLISDKVRAFILLILVVFVINMGFPQAVQAQSPLAKDGDPELVFKSAGSLDLLTRRFIEFENKKNRVVRTVTVVATAYSSDVAQTDSTPCITANGFDVCNHAQENIVAANFLPLGTKIKIPELYGNKIFYVHDRMNPRYDYRIDLWKLDRNRAISFGKRLVRVEVIE